MYIDNEKYQDKHTGPESVNVLPEANLFNDHTQPSQSDNSIPKPSLHTGTLSSNTVCLNSEERNVPKDVLLAVIAKFFPPAPVFMKTGLSKELLINSGLTLFGIFPGAIHAWYIILKNPKDQNVGLNQLKNLKCSECKKRRVLKSFNDNHSTCSTQRVNEDECNTLQPEASASELCQCQWDRKNQEAIPNGQDMREKI